MSEQQLIQLLKEADKDVLKRIYTEHRSSFIFFAQKFCSSKEDIVDAYQDAIIVLQEKAIQGKIEELNCTLKTYLFGIGKYMLYEKMRKQNKMVSEPKSKHEEYNYHSIATDFLGEEPNKKELQLQHAFATLGKKCKEILSLFYYRGYTIEEIYLYLNYENKNVVKSQKSRCIKQLKDKIKKNS